MNCRPIPWAYAPVGRSIQRIRAAWEFRPAAQEGGSRSGRPETVQTYDRSAGILDRCYYSEAARRASLAVSYGMQTRQSISPEFRLRRVSRVSPPLHTRSFVSISLR